MLSDTGRTDSYWMLSSQLRTPPALDRDLRTEVCVIGAGIAGVTTGYLLAKAGRRVVVLEDGAIGGGETGRTTAHLSNALDDRYHVLERLHGVEGARLPAASHAAAIDRIESTVREEGTDCDFQRLDGYLFVPPGDSPDILDQELEAARRAGVEGVTRVPRAPLDSFDTGSCLRFPRQGQFHPLSYVNGLVSAFERLGGRIFGDSHVNGVEAGPPAQVATESKRTVTADFVVCATNTPVIDWLVIHSKQAAWRPRRVRSRRLCSGTP